MVNINAAQAIKTMGILHKAMLGGLIVVAGITFYIVYNGLFHQGLQAYDHELQLAAIVFSFGGFFLGSAIFKKKVSAERDASTDLISKLNGYRTAAIIRWALLEGAVLFALVCFLMVGNYAFLALALVFMVFLAVVGPNKTKIMILLGLTEGQLD